eukprot:CAMPEP_0113661126 /NCGR_PEP_ID=MMETSP0017_2-20120614/33263_1 /TAXON_ID=2856 /ORGANISM="Cylindrotheca closterium" /LENGTH=130 /DNA_ID=CAMNT_0000575799 /DNA_START=62 /DNA_END=455 /DNA_ORIENTATION=- /assembly_acc=CAM_ASM_000147
MKLQSHQGEIKAKKEEETLAKQQAQVQEQQQKIQEEQEQQRKEEEELAKQKAEQELLIKQRREAEELVKAEQKIASIANVVDGEADVILESAKLPETLDGEDNEGQIQKVKVLVEQAEAKIKNLESVLDK